MEILELFKEEQKYWKKKNISLLGVAPIDEQKSFLEIQASLDKSCEKYWNSKNPCTFAKLLNDGTLDKNANLRKENSYSLKINTASMCIDVFGVYEVKGVDKVLKIASLPLPEVNLSWIIHNSHYTPRVTAARNNNTVVTKHPTKNLILGEWWNYDIDTETFKCILKGERRFDDDLDTIFDEHLSVRSKVLLQSVLGKKKLTKETFKEALSKVPSFASNSIFNYQFYRFEYFENLVTSSKYKAEPLRDRLLGINILFISQQNKNRFKGIDGQLVLSNSPIFSLENFRTAVNIYKSENDFVPEFSFVDSVGFFDSFKTATSNSAGRQRLLLDNVIIRDGLLWIKDENGEEHSMYEYINNPQDNRISCLSYSPFCYNNQAKRLMMTAKMSSQAVPLKDEIDNLTHRINARVIFADIEGYTYGDSIIISKSFAKRLETTVNDIINVSKKDKLYSACKMALEKQSGTLSTTLLKELYPTKSDAIIDSFEQAKIKKIDELESAMSARIFITYKIPFRLGDKISNLHGAKGTVGLILPDDEMPKLVKKAGNMEPGPMEIVISGFSTIRRGSLGQIFEAWAGANDIKVDTNEFISSAIKKYSKSMLDFSNNSLIEFKGKQSIKPIGIINIIRLYHHASIHISEAKYTDISSALKLGEMEKLNLLSQELSNTLKELSIRSMTKYKYSYKYTKDMQNTKKLPDNLILNLRFVQLLKSIGYNIKLDNKNLINSDLHELEQLEDQDITALSAFEIKA